MLYGSSIDWHRNESKQAITSTHIDLGQNDDIDKIDLINLHNQLNKSPMC